MNITDFLLARIEEDEADAQADAMEMGRSSVSIQFDCATQARFTPARALAECASKRGLLTLFRTGVKFEVAAGETTGWISPLIIMAIPYRDHPDYQQEWEL